MKFLKHKGHKEHEGKCGQKNFEFLRDLCV